MSCKTLKDSKLFKTILFLIPLFVFFIYFIDYFIRDAVYIGYSQKDSLLIELMGKFDGNGPYDALFKAVKSTPDFSMITNPLFSFLRPIPVIGEHITKILGMGGRHPPLYVWMAKEYPKIYSAGGGLAYMPQIEAYLTAGFEGCFGFGMVYGLIFGKKRVGLANLIIIAMSLLVSRGSLGVVGALMLPYVFLCYFLYNRFLFRTKI